MKKIILFAALMFVFAGCSSRRGIEYQPMPDLPARTSRENTPAPIFESGLASEQGFASESQRASAPRTAPERAPMPRENTGAFYKTEYDAADAARNTNISLAASAIDGKTVAPGETFSFNDTIGSTTEEFGYKSAVIFADGKKTEGFGGGVCQVSTTLCNAAAQAGMTIVERHDHSLPVAYVGDGLQAATSHNGGLDFKFKNEKPYAVVIRASAENGVISVSVERA